MISSSTSTITVELRWLPVIIHVHLQRSIDIDDQTQLKVEHRVISAR
jgi:hypothetical protein